MMIIDNSSFRNHKKIEVLENVLHRLEEQLEEYDSMFNTAEANRMTDSLYIGNKEWIALNEAESDCLKQRERNKVNRDENYAKEVKRLNSQFNNNIDNGSTTI